MAVVSSFSDRSTFFSDIHHDWYVIYCKTGRELFTSETMKATLGLITYVPEKKVWSKGSAHYVPFFPGYFFVRANLQKIAPSQINTSPGVLRLLACDDLPQKLPSHFVDMLHAEITRFNEYSCAPNQYFRPGDSLFVREGPFRGLEALFVGPTTPGKRAQILLNFMDRLIKAEIEVEYIERKLNSIKPKRARGTRGKGRKIRERELQ